MSTIVSFKEEARLRVIELVRAFQRNEADYICESYNETQARTDFITPFIEAFGWDVRNIKGQPLALREVIEEATVEVTNERSSKKPDYELRLARQRKLFIEAKKPSISIDRDRASAFQARRYGYSASLPIVILTNFYQLVVYDCQLIPSHNDEANVARYLLMSYQEFEIRFDELWAILSRESIYSGQFDRHFKVGTTRYGAEQFDDLFLAQVRGWREKLAKDIYINTPDLSEEELTHSVQLFLLRLVFLRICEDREIEKYETLRNLDTSETFDAFVKELRRADEFYDSGLFRLIDDRLGVRISDKTLRVIIDELYYPRSPYTFAVVETEVLGEIYEQFLGDVITLLDGEVKITNKPEVRESGGVVSTPRFIADTLTERTIKPLIINKSPEELKHFTVADICCGSGIFLISAYEMLCNHYLVWYLSNDRTKYIGHQLYEVGINKWRITFKEKRRILLTHLRGVDIDSNAVEVAKFSLLLKLIEDEDATILKDFVTRNKEPALPSLDENIRWGNSLISTSEWRAICGELSLELAKKIVPFDWFEEFHDEMTRGGFDVIIGNPPYIRIQNMMTYSREEVAYFQNCKSFTTANKDNFDKYALFIERSLSILFPSGRLGIIVPHKFMTIQSGSKLRNLIGTSQFLEEIVHFGTKQVFGHHATNYTCLLVLDHKGTKSIKFERAGPLEVWRYGETGVTNIINSTELGEKPWKFAGDGTNVLFKRILDDNLARLGQLADIFVGVQTSADKIYIFDSVDETSTTLTLRWNEQEWPIERNIVRPSLRDVTISAFARPKANTWMIFPYEIVKFGENKAQARLIESSDILASYPYCWEYLSARRKELEKRNITGNKSLIKQQWYQYGRSQSLTKFDTPKIILPVLSIEPRYAYDDMNIMVTGGGNGPYYMIRAFNRSISNHYLLAILNHPICEAFIRIHTSAFRGGYYSHGKQFIKDLPIPIPDDKEKAEIEILVATLIDTLDQLSVSRLPTDRTRREREIIDLKNQIEGYVTGVFNLSSADMDIIRSVPVPM